MKPRITVKAVLCLAFATVALVAIRRAPAAQVLRTSGVDLIDGKQLYQQKCAACHFSATAEKKIGPGLAGLMKHAKFKNGMAADQEHLRRVIERGGKDMPGFRDSLKEKQLRDLIAYVQTL